MNEANRLTTPFRDPLLPVFLLPMLAVAVRIGVVASYGDLEAYYGSSLGARAGTVLLAAAALFSSLLLIPSRRIKKSA